MHSDLALSDDVLEKIVAYVDREAGRDAPLSDEDEAMVRDLLATDADAQAAADELRATNAGLDALLDDVSAVEIPDSLIEMIRSHSAAEAGAEGGDATTKVVPFRSLPPDVRQRSYGPLAAAASLAALLSAGAGFHLYQSNEELRGSVVALQDERSSSDEEIAGLRSEAGDLTGRLAVAAEELKELRTELSTTTNARDAAEFDLARTNAELEGVRTARARLEQQFAALDVETRRSATRSLAEHDELRSQIASLEGNLRDANKAKRIAEAEIEKANAEVGELIAEAARLNSVVVRLELDTESLSAERDDQTRQLDETRTELAAVQEQVAELAALRGTLVATLDSRDLDLADRQTALAIAEQQLDEMTQDRNRLAEKDSDHRQRIVGLESDLNNARAEVAGLDAETEQLREQSSWLTQVAGYHLGYAGNMREVEITAEQERKSGMLTRWLSEQLGRDIAVPNLSGDGMTFVGGRLFFVNGQPVGQIAYHDREGRLTGFCIKPNPSNTEAPLTRQQYDEGLEMISWQDQNLQYALVGFEDLEVLQPIAERLEAIYGKNI